MKVTPPSEPRGALLHEVESYYSARLAEHGPTPRGVDWNGDQGQIKRFTQLEKIIAAEGPFSINDIGCGYGALLSFLAPRHGAIDYYGCDISAAMVDAARAAFAGHPSVQFAVEAEPSRAADYSVASGIFNVRFSRTDEEWRAYMVDTLDGMARRSRLGFAFNCLTRYSDADKMRDNLFYADPGYLFDLCKTRYARNVALLHDYGLFEFTMLVRMDA